MFYQSLCSIIHSVPKKDKLFLLGDFNARVGLDFGAWPGVLGIGVMNSYILLILSRVLKRSCQSPTPCFNSQTTTR